MIHLKIKTEYSFGKTFAPIKRVIERLKEIGCTAAAIVDDSTWGHVAWYKACKEANIQPMLGVEVCVSDDDSTTKMWFIAKNKEGLSELYNYTSKSYHQKVKTKFGSIPRLYKFDVISMSNNIIKFAGEITDGEFLKKVKAYIDISQASRILKSKKLGIAAQYKLPLVGVCDNAYSAPDDYKIFELISKAGIKQTVQYIPDSIEYLEAAAKIAKACKKLEIPKAPMIHAVGDLEKLCRDGIKQRNMSWDDRYETRLKYELDLIKTKNYESYFIIVADMTNYAKQHMLVGPSRGSAAGSLVCYLTRITEINPMENGLFFERFISVDRQDLPDIDLDFPDNKRHIVFEYMADKYGQDNVAHIGTITRFKPKSALIQVCKSLNIPPSATSAIKIAMIERSSADARASNCLEDTFKTTTPGKLFLELYPQAEAAMLIEGHASHTGVHAAGLLVCNDIITNYATVDSDGIAHVEKKAADYLGLLKIDVLGLRTLSILEDSGVDIDWYNLPMDDPATYDVFNKGRLSCIFQYEGNALKSIAELITFKTITEIDAVTALARPGPFAGGVTQKYIQRINGEPYEAIHPYVEPFMRDTFGLPVYQEQTMAIVREIGSFSWAEVADIRIAMSKSLGVEFFNKHWNRFKIGAAEKGINEHDAEKIWSLINAMGSWAMNKAHTFSYATISYWTAYLKAHHLLEFAAANLRNAKDDDSALLLLRELSKEGVEYIPFDINLSEKNWSVKDGKLVGGFMQLKGIGESKAIKIIEDRNAGRLTPKQIEAAGKAERTFADIFPFRTLYQKLYNDPDGNGISGPMSYIDDLKEGMPNCSERVFIGELIHKNPRNANEINEIKKRGGKIETGQLEYLDVRFRDDTGMIGGRIGRKDFLKIGVKMLQDIPIGSHILVRAAFYNGIRYAFIKKWKLLQ